MRQVFFDPFGKAAEGYNLGMQQQQNLEHNVRDARAQDYDFNVMAPYRLAGAQRQNTLETSNLPYQMQMAPLALQEGKIALATHQLPLAENWFRATGMGAPWASTYAHAFNMTPSADANGNVTYSMPGTNGQPVNVGSLNNQHALDFLNLPQQILMSEIAAKNNYYNSMAAYGRMGPYGAFYDYNRGLYYGAGGPTMGRMPQAQNMRPTDRFFPTEPGVSQQTQPSAMPQGMYPYNLPGGVMQQPQYIPYGNGY